MVQLNRYAQSTPPQFAAATVFCMWDRTTNLIEGANFQMNRFRGFGAPGAEFDPHPMTWRIALTVYALTCYIVMLLTFKLMTMMIMMMMMITF